MIRKILLTHLYIVQVGIYYRSETDCHVKAVIHSREEDSDSLYIFEGSGAEWHISTI